MGRHILELDDYEVANLAQALRHLQRIACDTGDWLGQIRWKLPVVDRDPNCTDDDLLLRVTSAKDVRAALGVVGHGQIVLRLAREDAQGLYDHTGTIPYAPGSWSNNARSALSEALHGPEVAPDAAG